MSDVKDSTDFSRRESDRRLDRIESKLDQVADALQTLARTEEKILAMNSRLSILERKMETGYNDHIKLMEAAKDSHVTSMLMDRVVLRLDYIEETLNKLSVKTAEGSVVTSAFERGFWVIFTALIGLGTYFLND